MKHKLLLSGSRRGGNISDTAHSFSSFAHSFGHLKLLVLSRGGRSKQLLLALPLSHPSCKVQGVEVQCFEFTAGSATVNLCCKFSSRNT